MPRNALLSPAMTELVVSRHDPDELVDVLRITSEELLEAFPDHVRAAYDRGDLPELEEGDDDGTI